MISFEAGRDEEIGDQGVVDPDLDGLAKGKDHHAHADRHRDGGGERGDRDGVSGQRAGKVRGREFASTAALRRAAPERAEEFCRPRAEMKRQRRDEKRKAGEDRKGRDESQASAVR